MPASCNEVVKSKRSLNLLDCVENQGLEAVEALLFWRSFLGGLSLFRRCFLGWFLSRFLRWSLFFWCLFCGLIRRDLFFWFFLGGRFLFRRCFLGSFLGGLIHWFFLGWFLSRFLRWSLFCRRFFRWRFLGGRFLCWSLSRFAFGYDLAKRDPSHHPHDLDLDLLTDSSIRNENHEVVYSSQAVAFTP
jgi:hypothetical protein